MVSKKDLNKAELETVRISKNPIMEVTAKGKVQTNEEATVYVRELDSFVTVMASWKYTGSFFHLENSAKNLGTTTIGPVARNQKNGKKNSLRHIKKCAIRRNWFINEFLYSK